MTHTIIDFLILVSLVFGAWSQHQYQRRMTITIERRVRARVILDRLRREGRGLELATLDELNIIHDALLDP